MEGLQAKTEGVKAAFENLANNLISSDLVGFFLDLAKALLQLADTGVGRVVVAVTLLTVAVATFRRLLETMNITTALPAFIGQIKIFISSLFSATTATEGLTAALSAAQISAGGLYAIIAALAVLLAVGLYELADATNVSYEEALENIKETNTQIEQNKQEIADLESKTEDLTEIEKLRLELLRQQNEELDKQLLEQRREAQAAFVSEHREVTLYEAGPTPESPITTRTTSEIEATIEQLQALRKQARETTDLEQLREIEKRIDSLTSTLRDNYASLLDFYEWFGPEGMDAETRTWLTEILRADILGDVDLGITKTAAGLRMYYELLGMTDEEIEANVFYQQRLAQEAEATAGTLGQESAALQTLITTLDNTKKSFDYLSQAWEEFNSDGSIAYSTISKIAEAFGDVDGIENYVSLLASGDLTAQQLNNTLAQLVDAKIQNEIASGNLTEADAPLVAKMLEEVGVANAATTANELLAQSFATVTVGSEQMTLAHARQELESMYQAAMYSMGALQYIRQLEAGISGFEMPEYVFNMPEIKVSGGGGGTTTTTTNPYEQNRKYLQSQLDLLQKQGAAYSDQITIIQQIQDSLHEEAESLRATEAYLNGDKETLAEVNGLSSSWYDWEEKKLNIIEEQNKLLQEQRDTYREAVDALASYMQDYADDQIDALNQQLKGLEAANQELEDQITLQEKLDAMARARQTKVLVYKDGMFQYVNDVDAVSAAASDLAAFQREQEYQSQRKEIEDQIDALEDLKQQWADLTNVYRDEQDRLLILQQLGIDMQSANFDEMLRNAKKFVADYAAIMASMAAIDFSGGSQANVVAQMQANSAAWYGADAATRSALSAANLALGTSMGWHRDEATGIWYTASGQRAYAHGTVGATGGMSLVGEHGAELRVLNQGDGIIPADITRNLWGWGSISPRQMAASMGMNITIGNLNLPGVRDGEGFVSYLRTNFFADAMQYAH